MWVSVAQRVWNREVLLSCGVEFGSVTGFFEFVEVNWGGRAAGSD